MLNNLLQMFLKLLKKGVIKKNSGATGDLIEHKISDKITRGFFLLFLFFTKVSKFLSQNTLEAISSKTEKIGFDAKIPKVRYISLEKKTINYSQAKILINT